jgi:hypothetical protein
MATFEVHHLFWPRSLYLEKGGIAWRFRNLPCCKVLIDPDIHKLLHAMQEPPTPPNIPEMKAAIDRHKKQECGCPNRKRRNIPKRAS